MPRALRSPVVEHRPCLADLSELELGSDGPLADMALRVWRLGSARAAWRVHRLEMLRLARTQVLEALRACRSWDSADRETWRRETIDEMRRLTRADLRSYWQAYRREMQQR